jgi:hypothetical protein
MHGGLQKLCCGGVLSAVLRWQSVQAHR